MKRGLIALAIVAGMGVGVTSVEANDYYRQSRIRAYRQPSYSCRVPTYYPRHRQNYPTTQRYPYAHPRTVYGYGHDVYHPSYYPSQGLQFGVHGRNFSLHLGY